MPPNNRQPNHARRACFLLAACGICGVAVLMLQLFRLQILRHDELESAAFAAAPPHGDPRLARDDL